jgi:hypothetical protein
MIASWYISTDHSAPFGSSTCSNVTALAVGWHASSNASQHQRLLNLQGLRDEKHTTYAHNWCTVQGFHLEARRQAAVMAGARVDTLSVASLPADHLDLFLAYEICAQLAHRARLGFNRYERLLPRGSGCTGACCSQVPRQRQL